MKKILIVLVAMMMISAVKAFDTTALQIGLWAPNIQLVPDDISVSGIKLNLPYGGNGKVVGLDLGLVSINNELSNDFTGKVSALQINLWNATDGEFSGFQVGLLNQAGDTNGIMIGLLNLTDDISRGLEIGLINTSLEFRGLEIGLVNYTQFLTGLQIGLVNIVTNSYVPVFPVLNFCF